MNDEKKTDRERWKQALEEREEDERARTQTSLEEANSIIADAQQWKRELEAELGMRSANPFDDIIPPEQLRSLLSVEAPPREYLVSLPYKDGLTIGERDPSTRGFLPRGIVAMVVSAGGTGKTSVLTQLAVAVARSTSGAPSEWLGHFEVDASGAKVLLALGEETTEEIQRKVQATIGGSDEASYLDDRFFEQLVAWPLAGRTVSFIDPTLEHKGEWTSFAHDLITHVEQTGPYALIVLDPASRFMGIEENDNQAATRFVEVLEALTKTSGNPTVLIAHHMNKKGAEDESAGQWAARGASALTDGVRWQMNMLRRDSNSVIPAVEGAAYMEVSKTNYTRRHEGVHIVRIGGRWRVANGEEERWLRGDATSEPERTTKAMAAGATRYATEEI